MKLNIADQNTAAQKTFEIEDEQRFRLLFDKRIAQEVPGEILGEQYADYVFKITGGFDKAGFAMKQGVLFPERKFLLLGKEKGFYRPKRDGCRKRKAVRGAIIGPDISVVNVVITKRGKQPIEGVTDILIPSRLGPKRASKIRKLFNLSKQDDVKKFVIRRPITKNGKVVRTKAPKIQRLVTPERLQRRRHTFAVKKERIVKAKQDAATYQKLLSQRRADKRKSIASKKSQKVSVRKSEKASDKPAAAAPAEKKAVDPKKAAAAAKKGEKAAAPAKAAVPAKKGEKKAAAPAEKKAVEKKVAAPAEKKAEKKAAPAAAPAKAAAPAEKKAVPEKKAAAPAKKAAPARKATKKN